MKNTEFNTSEFLAKLASIHTKDILGAGKKALVKSYEKSLLLLAEPFSKYSERIYGDYYRCRSFLIRDPLPLHEIYVPSSIASVEHEIRLPSVSKLARFGDSFILTGLAGSGKSMLVRHLLLNCLESGFKIPVLLELRYFNRWDGTLLEFIVSKFINVDNDLSESIVTEGLKRGLFFIILDGIDEVNDEKNRDLIAQIKALRGVTHRCIIIVTSRPESEFEHWDGFGHFEISPLTLSQASLLVSMVPFDEDVKRKFRDELSGGLYGKHKSFLSNPLLLIIMLLTYEQTASIPDKLSIFYKNAFDALFHQHDAKKGGYVRERKTKLDSADFARLFGAFCAITYDRRKFSFSTTEARDVVDAASKLTGLKVDSNDFVKDVSKAVCLILEDGSYLTFTHRSFQEYFTALFISQSPEEMQKKLVSKFASNVLRDSVISLLDEMRPDVIDRFLLIPVLSEIRNLIGVKRNTGITAYKKFLELAVSNIILHEGGASIMFSLRESDGAKYWGVYRFACRKRGAPPLTPENSIAKISPEIIRKYAKPDKQHLNLQVARIIKNPELIKIISMSRGSLCLEHLKFAMKLPEILESKIDRFDERIDTLFG